MILWEEIPENSALIQCGNESPVAGLGTGTGSACGNVSAHDGPGAAPPGDKGAAVSLGIRWDQRNRETFSPEFPLRGKGVSEGRNVRRGCYSPSASDGALRSREFRDNRRGGALQAPEQPRSGVGAPHAAPSPPDRAGTSAQMWLMFRRCAGPIVSLKTPRRRIPPLPLGLLISQRGVGRDRRAVNGGDVLPIIKYSNC